MKRGGWVSNCRYLTTQDKPLETMFFAIIFLEYQTQQLVQQGQQDLKLDIL